MYNINEATLFPELEHQLNYIRYANADFTQSVTEFSKYEDNHVVTKSDVYIDDSELNKYISDVLEEKLCSIVEKEDFKEVKRLIESNFDVDWYKRTSSGSRIKNAITGYFFVNNRNKEEAKSKANEIIAVLNDEVKAFIASKYKGGE